MPTTQADSPKTADDPDPTTGSELTFRRPTVNDGAAMWRLAKATGVLDLNSSYAYLMWGHDFAESSIIAEVGGQFAGFITGYIRPSQPTTLMVWQVATAEEFRGRGIAGAMLNNLFDHCTNRSGTTTLETTITADNPASIALFTRFGTERNFSLTREALFTDELFPDSHDTEFLYRIGPNAN